MFTYSYVYDIFGLISLTCTITRIHFLYLFVINLCLAYHFQPDKGIHNRQGIDEDTIIVDNWGVSQSPGTRVYMQIPGTVLWFSRKIPSDFDIMLLWFVGVDGCTKQSTGISSSGDHSTSVSASAGVTCTTVQVLPRNLHQKDGIVATYFHSRK